MAMPILALALFASVVGKPDPPPITYRKLPERNIVLMGYKYPKPKINDTTVVAFSAHWSFRAGNETKYSTIGNTTVNENGTAIANCTAAPPFGDRIKYCSYNLTLTNAQMWDQGTYKARIRVRGRNDSIVTTHRVTMQRVSPVLVPVRGSKHNLALRCVDATCKESQTWLQISGHTPHGAAAIRWKDRGRIALLTQTNAKIPYRLRAACCADWGDDVGVCGPEADIVWDGSLCTTDAPDRSWCEEYGAAPADADLEGGDGWEKYVPRYETDERCTRFTYGPNPNVLACYGHNVTLDTQAAAGRVPSAWSKEKNWHPPTVRRIGKNGTCLEKMYEDCTARLTVRDVRYPDFGKYRARFSARGAPPRGSASCGKNGTCDYFNVTVVERPGVALQLLTADPATVKLRCFNRGGPGTKVIWRVSGIYETYFTKGDLLTLLPDCWYNYKYWQSNLSVYCEVKTPVWTGKSSTFTMRAYRNGCGWRGGTGYKHLYERKDRAMNIIYTNTS